MYLGVIPDVLPLAPRPLQGELRSSWLLRVASVNALSLGELIDAIAARHPRAGVETAFLDGVLPPRVVAACAQFARLDESVVRELDLTSQLPRCRSAWMLRAPALQIDGRERVSGQRAAYAFCPRCLASTAPPATPPHLPVEWACAVITHCRIHRTRLLERCPSCFADDPFMIGVAEHPGRAECWHCEASLGLAEWLPDSSPVLEPVLRLQNAVMDAMRGDGLSLRAIEPSNPPLSLDAVAELLDLLVDDGDDPVCDRVAAVHWPGDVRTIGRRIPESRLAYLSVRVRFLAMACAASVMTDFSAAADSALADVRRTLVTSLGLDEWRHWQQRMVQWPARVRQRLLAARQAGPSARHSSV